MKYKILSLFFFLACVSLQGQMETVEYDMEGIKVIMKPSSKQVISVQLFLDGGTANYPKEQEGIEALTLDVVTQGGTTNNPKADFFGKLEKMGSQVGSDAQYDYATLSLRCLKTYWDNSWDLFVDAVNNPAFNEDEFKNIQSQSVVGAKQGEADADTYLRNTAMNNAFKGMNYSKTPEGSAGSLEKLTLDQIKDYYKRLLGKDQMVLVVVGDVKADDLKAKVKAAFGDLKAEGIPVKPEGKIFFNESSYNEVEREIATNYMRGYMNAPDLGSEDEVAMKVAMSILSNRYFDEIRTKRSLSYAPYAAYPSSILGNPYTFIYVSTDKPNEAASVMMDEITKICKDGFSKEELVNKKGDFLTKHYMSMETVSSQAGSLGRAALSGNWKRTEKFLEAVEGLSLEQINAAFKKYAKAINWTYLGDTSIVDKDVFLKPIGDK